MNAKPKTTPRRWLASAMATATAPTMRAPWAGTGRKEFRKAVKSRTC